MNRPSLGAFLVAGGLALGLLGWGAQAEARRLDVGIGAGALIGVEENLPVRDNYYAGVFAAMPLADKVDLELAGARSDGRDTADGSFREIYHVTAGIRLYPKTTPDSAARVYLAVGGSAFFDLKRDDDTTLGVYLGPGVRLRAGKQSGLDVRAPLVLSGEGATNPVLLPTLSWFYQF